MTSSSVSVSRQSASQSQWFLTYDVEAGVLVWKNGVRLKLSDDVSAGSAKTAMVEDSEKGIISVS